MIIEILKSTSRWEQYTRHKFVRMMKEGSLPLSAFRYYIIQDSKYVEEMNRASLKAASVAPDIDEAIEFINKMFSASDKGKEVHGKIYNLLKISQEEIKRTPINDVNYAYTRHLHYWADKDWYKYLVALTPCMLGYLEIGIFVKDSANPIYKEWAEFYASDVYKEKVDTIIKILNKINIKAQSEIDEYIDIFRRSVNYEIDFWDSGLANA
ncbi:MAG: TenA family protein [Sulfolobaceae archaeon]|nr:TenA family protein [Sulfolobaceae archaeon]